jgi:hypothetical protein
LLVRSSVALRTIEGGRGGQSGTAEDKRQPDPEPMDIAGHEAPGYVTQPLAGEHNANEEKKARYHVDRGPDAQSPPYTTDFCSVYPW